MLYLCPSEIAWQVKLALKDDFSLSELTNFLDSLANVEQQTFKFANEVMTKTFKGKMPQTSNLRAPVKVGKPELKQPTTGASPKTCNHCKKEGHFIKDCPKLKMRVNAVDTTESEPESSASTEKESEEIAWIYAPTED